MLTMILICALGVLGFYAYRRLQRGAYLFGGTMDAPAAVRSAAKRLDYRVQPDVHATLCIHTPEICVAAMATAFAQMDPETLPEGLLIRALEKRLTVTPEQAADMATLGAWVVTQAGGPTPAFQRLTKRLKQLDHGPDFDKLMRVLGDVTAAGTKGMPSAPQADALGALARIFRTA